MTLRLAELIESYVDELKEKGTIRSEPVEQAFRRVERHLLLEGFYELDKEAQERFEQLSWTEKVLDPSSPEPEILAVIYSDSPLVIRVEDGRPTSSTSQPALVAEMLELLELERGMNVLEIGAGTGYNAALMGEIVGPDGHITTIDIQQGVVEQTKRLLKGAGYDKIKVIAKDGALGHPEIAPYDRIVATVGCPDISFRWAEQLADGGFMLIPLQHGGEGFDPLTRIWKEDGKLIGRFVGWSGFMSIQGELAIERKASFAKRRRPLDEKPTAEYPLFGLFKEGKEFKEKRRDEYFPLELFIGISDGRASWNGLWDEEKGAIVIKEDKLVLYGDESLYQDLKNLCEQWEELGRPGLSAWRLEFFPRNRAPEIHEGERVWVIERQFSKEIIRLDSSRK